MMTDAEMETMMKDMETPTAPETTATPAAVPVIKSSDGTALNMFINSDQVKADISINTSDLDTMMIEHPGLELHYALQTANARRQFERLKAATEILEAKIDADVRRAADAEGGKKPPETAIKALVLTDKRYSSATSKLIDAQHIWKLCEATENAFHSRKDMLLEVARDRRKEKEGQMRVLEGQEMRQNLLDALAKKAAA